MLSVDPRIDFVIKLQIFSHNKFEIFYCQLDKGFVLSLLHSVGCSDKVGEIISMRTNTKIIIETTNPPIQLLSHDTNTDLENADIQVEKTDMRKKNI